MGRTVPETQQAAIDFFAVRIPGWAEAPPSIGLTPETVDGIGARVAAARARLAEARAARVAAETATLALSQAMAEMRAYGGDLVKTIRTFAETTGDTRVFVEAGIPPVSPPTPPAPPAAPTRLAATLLRPFGVGLSWRAPAGGGVWFGVWRRVAGADGFTLLDTTAARRYEDRTLPAGAGSAGYFIAAHRGAFRSNGPAIEVRLAGHAAAAAAAAR